MEERDQPLRPPPAPRQPIHQPSPQRPGLFSLTPLNNNPNHSQPASPNSPSLETDPETPSHEVPPSQTSTTNNMLDPNPSPSANGSGPFQKTRSIVNLTSSTLFGIYSPTGYDANRDEPSTPWGSGAQTPRKNTAFDFTRSASALPGSESMERARQQRFSEQKQIKHVRSMSGSQRIGAISRARWFSGVLVRLAVLFCVGLAYGEFVRRLHDSREVAPVQVEGIRRRTWRYLVFWGIGAVGMGSALPWVDGRWGGYGIADGEREGECAIRDEKGFSGDRESERREEGPERVLGADWNPIVRTVGAFVGIAFAIRRLPWQSTLQVSLTLALVNPVIWYLVDRSRTGFALASMVSFCGAAALLVSSPEIIPSPATPNSQSNVIFGAGLSYESIGVATWISSVLFCSCICFGNLGRRLSKPGQSFA